MARGADSKPWHKCKTVILQTCPLPSRKPFGTSTKRFFHLLTYTLKSSSCVALLDVVESLPSRRMRPPRPAVGVRWEMVYVRRTLLGIGDGLADW